LATIKGTDLSESKYGGTADDLIYGYGGNDSLYGRAGADQIWGGLGGDKIWGEAGNDILRGEAGADTLYGGDGNDIVYGGADNDTLYGDAGTDTLKGEAGNDIMKGGTGISYMYGGDGSDTFYYNPSSSNIKTLGNYLAPTQINGDAGFDTAYVYNDTTYTSGTVQKPTETYIWVEGSKTHLRYDVPNGAWDAPYSEAGTLNSVEKIIVADTDGPVFFIGDLYANTGVDITGGAKNDTFQSYYGSDKMRGGGGNDTFFVGGGDDIIYSEANDADTITFNGWGGSTTINGFNGAGLYGGDRIEVPEYYVHDINTQMVESNGSTTISLDSGDIIKVVGVTGLDLGVDIFLV
jgi:hypothetical protein